MSKLKFWACFSILSSTILFLIWNIIFAGSASFDFLSNNPFNQPIAITLNYFGIYFGLPGIVLWIGRRVPYSSILLFIGLYLGIFAYFLIFFSESGYLTGIADNFGVILGPLGLMSLLLFIVNFFINRYRPEILTGKSFVSDYFWLTALFMTLGWSTSYALDMVAVILPNTIDYDVYKIDLAFNHFAESLTRFYEVVPATVKTLVYGVYSLLSIMLLLCIGLVLAEKKDNEIHVFRVLVVPFACAFVLYCINSVSGPAYAFLEHYPNNISYVLEIVGSGTWPIPPAPRNGMPSMHFTGALLIVLVTSCLVRKKYFYIACIFASITFFATMALGEHYLLDLIVAAPFALALGTALLNPPNWNFSKRRLWWLCVACFIVWEISLITIRPFLIDSPWFVRLFSLISVGAAIACFYQFLTVVWHMPVPQQYEVSKVRSEADAEDMNLDSNMSVHWIYGLFVASGFAGLLYEVVFAKRLGVTFGGTSLAAYTVMGTYMGGMALGAWIGGLIADRVRSPLKWYAIFEGSIGFYALLTPFLFDAMEHIYIYLAQDIRPDAGILTFWRVLLGAAVLGIPTVLMGTTLPIMFKYLYGWFAGKGKIIANLYTANIIGAAFGALLGGYFVLPALGLLGSTRLAALLSLMIALYTLDKLKNMPVTCGDSITKQVSKPPFDKFHVTSYSVSKLGITALLLVTVGGMVTLALEIVNMHMLAIIAGNSVYAFGLMLATFLFGLGAGSYFYKRLNKILSDPLIAAFAQFGIFFSIVMSAFQWDGLTDYFASFFYMEQFHHFNFGARELIRGGVCAVIMVPPAFFIGLGYPATMALSSGWLNRIAHKEATGVGIASLCNTFGNITGVLLAGFVLLNWLGSNRMLLLLAVVSLLLAIIMLVLSYGQLAVLFKQIRIRYFFVLVLSVSVVAALISYPSTWNLQALTTGANVYFQAVNWGKVIDSSESIEGGLTTVSTGDDDNLTLLTNGKFQGNNTGEVEAQKAVALIPLLHAPSRFSALVIGYGTGNSAHVLHDQNFEHVDIVELSKDIVIMADKFFGNINDLVSRKDNVNLYYTDGRNFLLTQNKRYDLISMEISSIWFAGAANLYNREFYKLAKKRLTKHGVLQQWVQLHHMRPIDLLYIINTINQEFDYVWLYVSGGQGILVATDSLDAVHNLYNLEGKLVSSLDELNEEEKKLSQSALLDPDDINYISQKLVLPKFFTSNDNNLYLEYATPKGNSLIGDVFAHNIEMLENFKKERVEDLSKTKK